MIPTLFGRWQTRIYLTLFVGLWVTALVTYLLWQFYPDFSGAEYTFWRLARTTFTILAMVLVIGLVWDLIYMLIQKPRWDRDWPFAFQFLSGIWEGVIIYLIIRFIALPFLPDVPPLDAFSIHYLSVFLISFAVLFGPLKTAFPVWRYHGGQFIGR